MDPVTRIEGHLKVEVTVDSNTVTDARCTGTLFRGFEAMLEGRDPSDGPVITQRICGVCPIAHGMAAVKALDAALGRAAPDNGRLLRNLVLGANFIQSHILHFYLLASLDYIRGPETSPWVPAWEVDLRSDPALSGIAAHLPEAIAARRIAHEMGALFSGRMPSSHAYIAGGFTATPGADEIGRFRDKLSTLSQFIRNVYIPDVETLAGVYSDYFSIGSGYGNLLAFGVFDEDESGDRKLLNRGYVEDADPGQVETLLTENISEAVSHSWYDDSTGNLHPSLGRTLPIHPDSKAKAYSWLKSPRYMDRPFEVGPLARMWVNGDYRRGVSVMDRHAARAHEARKIADAMNEWLDQLVAGAPVYASDASPADGYGAGLTEAPRGALGHWVEIAGGKISHYQVVTPTCWNASPRDDWGNPGPVEKALIGTPVQDPARPVEALRVIHSFDPCLSCAVHVMQPKGKPVVVNARTL